MIMISNNKQSASEEALYNVSLALSLLTYPNTVSYKLFLGFCNIANKNDTLLKDDWSRLPGSVSFMYTFFRIL